MSTAFDRGRAYERNIRKITARMLKFDVQRDKQSGAGIHKQDIRDRYGELPIFIECKDQKTTKLKEWWREADSKSSYGQAPIVVFPDNEENLCVMRYTDLLQMIRESMDWRETTGELRQPVKLEPMIMISTLPKIVREKTQRGAQTCRNGHISDEWGYCMQRDCKYARGYKVKRVKDKGSWS